METSMEVQLNALKNLLKIKRKQISRLLTTLRTFYLLMFKVYNYDEINIQGLLFALLRNRLFKELNENRIFKDKFCPFRISILILSEKHLASFTQCVKKTLSLFH